MNVVDFLPLVSDSHSVVLKIVDDVSQSAESAPATSFLHDPLDMARIGNLANSRQTPNLTLSMGSLQPHQDNNTQNNYIGALIHAWKAANQDGKYWMLMPGDAALDEQFSSGLYSTLRVVDTAENAHDYLAQLQGSGANVYVHPQAFDDAANTNPIWIFSCGEEVPPDAADPAADFDGSLAGCVPNLFGHLFGSVIGINLDNLRRYEWGAGAL